ncbi:MAG: lysophospholipase [Rhizobacter sp.]|jgi:alpha-beta hydrolase superfamily lysophospholipase
MLSILKTPDGLNLHVAHHAGPDDARGTVVLVHGLGEHGGRYAHVVQALLRWGWHVVTYDHRGHGRSDGRRGGLAEDDSLLCDLGQVVAATRAEHVGPIVLLGHSMGGAVAARYVAEGTLTDPQRWFHPVDALVLSSPALDAGLSRAQLLQLRLMGWVAPNLPVGNGLKPEWVSRDAGVVAAYVADPLVHDRITPRLVRFIVEAGEAVRCQAASWNLPTLLMWAGSDRCVAPRGSEAFAAAAPPALVTARPYPALYHEIFNEPERDQVLQCLGDWLAAR